MKLGSVWCGKPPIIILQTYKMVELKVKFQNFCKPEKLDCLFVPSPDQHADTGTAARAAPAIQKVVAAIYGRQIKH